ncbi:type II restriction enzyme, partial [Hyella patelloides]|uniref:type II restriction enzyme n=1 Tax=Hyella patelloides TaxID=1982969 RepID=UPI003CCC845B
MSRAIDKSWEKIFLEYDIQNHDFSNKPFYITARQIKVACQNFTETGEKEPRILC